VYGDRNWEIADSGSVAPGEDLEEARDRLCAQADIRVVLLSPAYLTDPVNTAERDRVLHQPGRRVVFALTGLPDGPSTLGPLHRREVRLFARALLDRRPSRAPLPLLFDLRDVRVADLDRVITLDAILDSMLGASRPGRVPRERLSADTVRRRLAQGDRHHRNGERSRLMSA
jgi:hypothetical protein